MKTVKFFTLGCKVNQYETQEMREKILPCGFKEVVDGRKADLYVINSCTVTQRADADSLGCIRKALRQNPQGKIIFTGCLAELEAEKLKTQHHNLLVLKNSQKPNVLKFLSRSLGDLSEAKNLKNGITSFENHTRAFLKVQDGCNNRCSYCRVPLARGKSRSKPLAQVLKEAGGLVNSGVKEIVLCGICLGAYGRDLKPAITLVKLINGLENIENLVRIRLSSIEAGDVSGDLIRSMAHSDKACRHLHIPMQSGDNQVLRLMNRRYTQARYLRLVDDIRSHIPDIAITTDVLVGFPGETPGCFQNTITFIKKIKPLRVHVFPYSARPGTKAAFLKSRISTQVIKERVAQVRALADKCSSDYKIGFLGKCLPVLFEARLRENSSYWCGYSDNYLRVCVASKKDLRNKLVPVRIIKLGNGHLRAEID